jgi:DNA-directed RNA polymerase II subunit RPB1
MLNNYAYYAEVKKMEFYVLGSEENYVDSAVSVTNKELFKGDMPVPGGCYDPSMGSTEYAWACGRCGHDKKLCSGHSGSLDLHYPVKSPLFRDGIIKWLKIICFKCGRLIVNRDITLTSSKLLGEYVRLSKGINKCPWDDCQEPHPSITKDKYKPSIIYADYRSGKASKPEQLYNHIIKDIFSRITNETVLTVGKPVICHPKNFILDIIRIPPNTIRPDIKRVGGSRSNNSDITAFIKGIVDINEKLPLEIPALNKITNDLDQVYFNLDLAVFEMIKGSSQTNNQVRFAAAGGKPMSSIASRIPKKTGRIRKSMMGKRTYLMGRSVISGDNTLRVDEIGVPIKLAKSMQIPETVRSYNRDKLNIYYMNRRNIYPGCTGVEIKGTGKYHKIEHLDPNYELQEGDIIFRDIVDGDYVGFNRQPSLLFGQIGSHKVKIMEKSNTIRINVSACAPYSADFDGDCANIIIAQNIQSRTELQKMSWIGNWMVSYQNHSPYFGSIQDCTIGSAELTRSDVMMDKWHAMQLFANVTPPQEGFNFDKSKYTGRSLIGKFLPKINYPKKKASFYLPQYAPFIKYDPDEIFIQINRGELISGSLDKATMGQQVMGSIFHIINNEYGANAALGAIHNFHQIVSRFFLWSGFTVGIQDINISGEALNKVHEQTASMKEEARQITEQLNNRNLINPLGVKLSHYYEQKQLNALEPGDSFVIPILNDIDFRNNRLARLIFTGSKGKKSNMININGSVGQVTINGKRPPRNFSWGRTSPYFLRYDNEPNSLGFIETSYREGIEPEVFPFAAGDARFSSISNALSTSVSGAQSRISVKNLESIVTNNLRQAVKDENIVQILFADAGVDTRRTEAVKFLTVLISNKEMEEQYHASIKQFNSIYHNADVQKLLDEEFKQLVEDRMLYRTIFLWAENNNPGQYLLDHTQQMPINPFRIIEDIIYNYEDVVDKLPKEKKILDPVLTISKVRDLCDNIAYMYFNSQYEKRKQKVPAVHKTAVTLLCILIRTYLCTAGLARKNITNYHVDMIINKIKITFKNSLIDYGVAVGILAAQCLSQPVTQYALDSRHRGGGAGGGTSFNVIERYKEILGAKSTESLKTPMMLIMVLPEYEKDKVKVQEIANHIEVMDFERFISSERIFFEPYGQPQHPNFKHEEKMIKTFEKNNAGMRMQGDITKWCIRYEINKEELIINSMKLDTIITKLRLKYPDMFLVYTSESSETIIIRAYLAQSMIKIPAAGFSESVIIDLAKKISKTVIRGVKNITYTEVTNIAKSEVKEDGSIESNKVYGITTFGTNLEDVLENPYVDKYRTQTNSIAEFEEMYGIEATRNKIITEIRKTMSSEDVTRQMTSVFADEMTSGGRTSSIQKTGLQTREASNVTLRLSFQSPIQVIENAAIDGIVDNIHSVSGPLINGQAPTVGTIYNNVHIDESFVEHYMKNLGKAIEDEL